MLRRINDSLIVANIVKASDAGLYVNKHHGLESEQFITPTIITHKTPTERIN